MATPYKERYFEDYQLGEVVEFGEYVITEEEITDFARRYDPQPFHLDQGAGAQSHFGGLIASGWMTASVLMRLMVDHYIPAVSSMGSPGVDELRWLYPVRPGDKLRARITVLELRRSQTKPDRGLIQMHQEVFNQNGQAVMSSRGWSMYKTREVSVKPNAPAAAPAAQVARTGTRK